MQFLRRPLAARISSLFVLAGSSLAWAADTELPPVHVIGSGNAAGSAYFAPVSSAATKVAVPLKDVPQTINVITRELIEDQNATSYQDVLRAVPGVGLSVGDGQRDQVTIRGFSAINDQFVDGVRDDAMYFRDLSNVERIEVLKGPASVLYGRGSAGGLINRVTKKPQATPVQSVALSFDQHGQQRIEGDLGLANAADSARFRVTGAHEDSQGFRDQYFIKRDAISPSAQFNVAEGTTVLLQGEFLDDRRLADQGVPAYRGKPVDVDRSTYFGSARGKDQTYVQTDVAAGTATIEHRLAPNLRLRNVTRAYDYSLDRNYTTISRVTDRGAASTVTIARNKRLRDEQGVYNQTELSQQIEQGAVRHDLLYGVEIGQQHKQEKLWARANAATYSLFNPQLVVLPEINLGAPASNNNDNRVEIAAVYVQDMISLGERWKVLAGLRYDRISQKRDDLTATNLDLQRTDQVWSPRLGVVYQPDPVSSYYASASRSFQPIADSFTFRRNSDQFRPERTTSYEIGAKYDLNQGKSALTAALFNVTRDNILTSDPNNSVDYAATGSQRTRGVEIALSGEVAAKWQVQVGYAFLDAEITKSSDLVNGVSVEGNRPSLTPAHSFSFWVNRELGHGFSVGGGAQYVGARYASNDEAVKLDSYVVADSGLYYRSGRFDVSFTLKNLFDRKYFVAAHSGANDYNMPGAPRTAAVTLRTNF